jgi:hypothetical protein
MRADHRGERRQIVASAVKGAGRGRKEEGGGGQDLSGKHDTSRAGVVQNGQTQTFPALYLWNQPSKEANHTPAWDVFDIPPVSPK